MAAEWREELEGVHPECVVEALRDLLADMEDLERQNTVLQGLVGRLDRKAMQYRDGLLVLKRTIKELE